MLWKRVKELEQQLETVQRKLAECEPKKNENMSATIYKGYNISTKSTKFSKCSFFSIALPRLVET